MPVRAAELVGGQPGGAGVAQPRQQPELEARVHVPGAVEAAEAGDQVVEAVVEAHVRIVARGHAPRSTPRLYAAGMPSAARMPTSALDATHRLRRVFRMVMDDTELALPPRRGPRRDVRDPRRTPTWTAATRSPCASSATRTTPRRSPRTPSSGPTGRSRATSRRGSAICASGLARDDRAQPVPQPRPTPPCPPRRSAPLVEAGLGAARRSRPPTRRRRAAGRRPRAARRPPRRAAGALPGPRRPAPRGRPLVRRARGGPRAGPRARSRPRSTAAWRCCGRR